MLISISDYYLRYYHRYSNIYVQVQNATLAETQDGYVYCARFVSIHPSTTWNPAIWTQIHASVYGYKMVSTRAWLLLRGSHFLWSKTSFDSPFLIHSQGKISNLTNNCRPEFPSALLRADSISWALYIKSSISPFCTPYTSTHSRSGRLS